MAWGPRGEKLLIAQMNTHIFMSSKDTIYQRSIQCNDLRVIQA